MTVTIETRQVEVTVIVQVTVTIVTKHIRSNRNRRGDNNDTNKTPYK